MTMHPPCDFTS